jgi:hypothetical protein
VYVFILEKMTNGALGFVTEKEDILKKVSPSVETEGL